MRGRLGTRRGFSRLSDRLGTGSLLPAARSFVGGFTGTINTTFTAPRDGTYVVRAWGPGGSGRQDASTLDTFAGGGGAFGRKTVVLEKGDVLSIELPAPVANPSGVSTKVTRVGKIALIAPAGGEQIAGTGGSGGDVNVDGQLGANSPAGSGIAGYGGTGGGDTDYPGGLGATGQRPPGRGGGGYSVRQGTAVAGQAAEVVIAFQQEAP